MGPRSFDRGNASEFMLMHKAPIASMGPRSFDRGNDIHGCGIAQLRQLQWGRGLLTAEITTTSDLRGYFRDASMGPRSFDRGNEALLGATELPYELQWGRGLLTADICCIPVAW